jgi:hypothetical protein
MKRVLFALALAGTALLAACETVPYEDRVKAFEDSINARFIGRSSDDLILAFGPPHSSYKLSDGRDVLQYSTDRTITSGGGSYTSYQTITRDRRVRDPDGTVRVVQERQTVPVTNSSPIETINQVCTQRFVVSRDKRVESFNWQGNACFDGGLFAPR